MSTLVVCSSHQILSVRMTQCGVWNVQGKEKSMQGLDGEYLNVS